MTSRRWPILDLDDGATEAEIRRAYAKRLRAQGPDADVASFQALRSEFEAALESVRSGARVVVTATTTARRDPEPEPEPTAEPATWSGRAAFEDITQRLTAGDLPAACDRFDLARVNDELTPPLDAELELALARGWLADTSLDDAARLQIVRRYHWDDVLSALPIAADVMARLQAAAPVSIARPGQRFIGQWNWGAFFLAPLWMMAHGLVRRGVVLLIAQMILFAIPYGFIISFVVAGYAGRNGNALAVKHRFFTDERQFVAVQNAWRNWGFAAGVFEVMLAVGVVWGLATAP